MKITNVRIRKIEDETRLRAVASITIDDCFVIHELRIIDGKEGLFVAMPSKKVGDNKFKDIVHPINKETREQIETIVIEKYNELENE